MIIVKWKNIYIFFSLKILPFFSVDILPFLALLWLTCLMGPHNNLVIRVTNSGQWAGEMGLHYLVMGLLRSPLCMFRNVWWPVDNANLMAMEGNTQKKKKKKMEKETCLILTFWLELQVLFETSLLCLRREASVEIMKTWVIILRLDCICCKFGCLCIVPMG